jgi:hypothetical protein
MQFQLIPEKIGATIGLGLRSSIKTRRMIFSPGFPFLLKSHVRNTVHGHRKFFLFSKTCCIGENSQSTENKCIAKNGSLRLPCFFGFGFFPASHQHTGTKIK